MSMQIALAKAVAIIAHRNQRYGTRSYSYHLEGVATDVHNETQGDEIMVSAAWLHDILEDTDVSWMHLSRAGIPSEVRELVEVLTHKYGEPYEEYIRRVGRSRRATKIKLADLRFNLRHNPRENLKERYEAAIKFLEDQNWDKGIPGLTN